MFNNIGQKIKTLAKVLCGLGIFIPCLAGIVNMLRPEIGNPLTGLVLIVVGSLGSWVGSFMTYGIGQLIENTDILVSMSQQTPPPMPVYLPHPGSTPPSPAPSATPTSGNASASSGTPAPAGKPVPVDKPAPESTASSGSAPAARPPIEHKWRCDGCGNLISEMVCPYCNTVTPGAEDSPASKTKNS